MPQSDDNHRNVDSLWRKVAERPWILAGAVLAALVLLPLAVWLDLRNLSDTSLATQARTLNAMISDIRAYYGANVVGLSLIHI